MIEPPRTKGVARFDSADSSDAECSPQTKRRTNESREPSFITKMISYSSEDSILAQKTPKRSVFAQFLKVAAAEAAEAEANARASVRAAVSPRAPPSPELDAFVDSMEQGHQVESKLYIMLISVPLILTFLNGVAMGGAVFIILNAGIEVVMGRAHFDVVRDNVWVLALTLVILQWMLMLLTAILKPTYVKGIFGASIGLMIYFIGCGLLVCPFLIVPWFPDPTGRAKIIWHICGFVKCVFFTGQIAHAVYFMEPRDCIMALESATTGYIAGLWIVTASAAYFSLSAQMELGHDTSAVAYTWLAMLLVTAANVLLCLYGAPRKFGSWLTQALHACLLPGVPYDLTVLHSTLAVMLRSTSRATIERAVASMRAVPASEISYEEFTKFSPDSRCYVKSIPVRFREVDYFVSHSWRDHGEAKWNAFQAVRQKFKQQHGREPLCWIDKFCIDQLSIEESIRRLPVFVAGSKKMLVLYGSSYPTRSWCVLELIVFASCQRVGLLDAGDLEVAPLLGDKGGPSTWDVVTNFHMKRTYASDESDKKTIMGVVETGGDGQIGCLDALRAVSDVAERNQAQKLVDLEAQVVELTNKLKEIDALTTQRTDRIRRAGCLI